MAGTAPGEVGFEDRALEVLWYRLAALRWRALALVAPGRPELASRLLRRLMEGVGGPSHAVRAVDAAAAPPRRLVALAHALRHGAERGSRERVLVAVPSPAEVPEARELIGACDASVLVLLERESRFGEVERALSLVDRDRVLGAVLARRLRIS